MNRINPLYIGLVLVVIMIFLVIQLFSVRSELADAKKSYAQRVQLSIHLSGLKEVYDDKERVKSAIKRILGQSSLKLAKIEQEVKKDKIVISSHEMDIKALNSFMGKILNGSYNISILKVTNLNKTNASLYMEIIW